MTPYLARVTWFIPQYDPIVRSDDHAGWGYDKPTVHGFLDHGDYIFVLDIVPFSGLEDCSRSAIVLSRLGIGAIDWPSSGVQEP